MKVILTIRVDHSTAYSEPAKHIDDMALDISQMFGLFEVARDSALKIANELWKSATARIVISSDSYAWYELDPNSCNVAGKYTVSDIAIFDETSVIDTTIHN